jgi:hypothetical protein
MEPSDIRENTINEWIENDMIDINEIIIEEIQPFIK